jgi:shikimate kinase
MIIYLVGYMGSGKSTAGNRLARKLDFDFLDLDLAFESRHGVPVAQFILERGEESFRLKESDLLQNLHLTKPTVISTGGGTPCFHENMDFMNKTGLTVYLQMHENSLYTRVTEAKTERPLLKGLVGDNLRSFISEHLESRREFYEMAHLTVKGESLDLENLSELIKSQINYNPKNET